MKNSVKSLMTGMKYKWDVEIWQFLPVCGIAWTDTGYCAALPDMAIKPVKEVVIFSATSHNFIMNFTHL